MVALIKPVARSAVVSAALPKPVAQSDRMARCDKWGVKESSLQTRFGRIASMMLVMQHHDSDGHDRPRNIAESNAPVRVDQFRNQ